MEFYKAPPCWRLIHNMQKVAAGWMVELKIPRVPKYIVPLASVASGKRIPDKKNGDSLESPLMLSDAFSHPDPSFC